MSKEVWQILMASSLTAIGVVVWEFVNSVEELQIGRAEAQKHIMRVDDNAKRIDDHEERIRYVERHYQKKQPLSNNPIYTNGVK